MQSLSNFEIHGSAAVEGVDKLAVKPDSGLSTHERYGRISAAWFKQSRPSFTDMFNQSFICQLSRFTECGSLHVSMHVFAF